MSNGGSGGLAVDGSLGCSGVAKGDGDGCGTGEQPGSMRRRRRAWFRRTGNAAQHDEHRQGWRVECWLWVGQELQQQ